ncbi:MAG TPA: hypothetical protein VIP52_03285 [Candidatus Dormibacteraeota bacterium]|jgi:hypothetical protein
MSRYDLEAERRGIDVGRAFPVRVEAIDEEPNEPDLPSDLHVIMCAYCGIRLTIFDRPSGLISLDRWSIDGWTWRPVRGHHQARTQIRTSPLAMTTGSWKRGDNREIALFPVSAAHGWRRPNLPAILECYGCHRQSALTADQLPDKLSPA